MKKVLFITAVLVVAMAMALTGCGSSGDEASTEATAETAAEESTGADISGAEIDLGESDIYSEDDRDAAVQMILEEFSKWDGCRLINVRYAGDDASTDENLDWMNELAEGQGIEPGFNQCIEFLTDFHSPVETKEETAWELDKDYKDYQWWLARRDNNEWVLMTEGY